LRALATANLAEVARLEGHPEEAERLGRRAVAALEELGDPGHRRRVLATIGLALAEAGRLAEAEDVLRELCPPDDAEMDGPAAVVEGAIAGRRGEEKRAAECFARAAAAYEGGHDPRDVVAALVGLVVSSPDRDARQAARMRLDTVCRAHGITLLPRERRLLDGK
jgi:hypothetical protein